MVRGVDDWATSFPLNGGRRRFLRFDYLKLWRRFWAGGFFKPSLEGAGCLVLLYESRLSVPAGMIRWLKALSSLRAASIRSPKVAARPAASAKG